MASSLQPVVRHLPSDEEIRELLADQIDVQHKSVGMVVGIITPEGRRVVSHGSTSRHGGHAVGGDTAFEIASVTKVFTSLLLVEMVERGEVALDDPLARFLPADVHVPQRNGRHITLVDLATHTSGLPPQPPDLLGLDDPIARTYSLEQLYSSLSSYRLTRDIGSEWEYGNLDMALLGHALARRAGTDYETLLSARITGPLGLSRTSTMGASLGPNVAVSHDSDLHPTDRLAMGALAPTGAMMSSANDLLTLLGACLGIIPSPVAPALQAMSRTRRSMQPPLLTMMRRYGRVMLRMVFSRRLRSRTSRVFSRVEQALGWYVLGRGSEEMVVHDGAGPSCAASIAYDATAHAGVVVLTNAGITVQDISRHVLWRDSPLARLRKQVTLNSGVLDRYVGTYQSPASPLFEILRDGDRLFIRVPYMAKLPFRAESEHDFYVSELQWEFVFDWDGRGRVREMLFGARRGQPMLPLQKR
jgi:serine-type D-Ala-D-Ala carboxypeptidase/endopeptidase